MDIKEYERLKAEITGQYERKIQALDILYGDLVPAGNGSRKQKKATAQTCAALASKQLAKKKEPTEEKPVCQHAGCNTRLYGGGKKCLVCGKLVCSKHWERSNDSCAACSQVAS